MMTDHSIHQLLKEDNKSLGTLFAKLKQLNQWNNYLKACFNDDDPLPSHCQVVNLSGNSLIVIADSPHWVTRLRFHIPDLLAKLQQYPDLANIKAICCKVLPNAQLKRKKNPKPMTALSPASAAVLKEAAEKITDNKLRAILERIANRKIE